MANLENAVLGMVAKKEDSFCLFPMSWSFDLVDSEISEIFGNVLSTLEPLPPLVESVENFNFDDRHLINVRLPKSFHSLEAAVTEIECQSRPSFLENDEGAALFYFVSLPGKFQRRFISTDNARYRSGKQSEGSPAASVNSQVINKAVATSLAPSISRHEFSLPWAFHFAADLKVSDRHTSSFDSFKRNIMSTLRRENSAAALGLKVKRAQLLWVNDGLRNLEDVTEDNFWMMKRRMALRHVDMLVITFGVIC